MHSGFETWKYDVMRNVAGGKPLAIGECDKLPETWRLANEPLWAFFMSWSELTFSANSGDKIREVYGHQRVITRDEMGDWQNGGGGPGRLVVATRKRSAPTTARTLLLGTTAVSGFSLPHRIGSSGRSSP